MTKGGRGKGATGSSFDDLFVISERVKAPEDKSLLAGTSAVRRVNGFQL